MPLPQPTSIDRDNAVGLTATPTALPPAGIPSPPVEIEVVSVELADQALPLGTPIPLPVVPPAGQPVTAAAGQPVTGPTAQPVAAPSPPAGPGTPQTQLAIPPAGASISPGGQEILPPPFPWWGLIVGLGIVALVGRK